MTRHGETGFSLVEVIIALGLMVGVLASVAGLFVLGAGQVKSGRTATEALSVAQTILEEMQSWGFAQMYSNYGLDGTSTSYVVDTRTNSYASKWQPTLDQRFLNGYATIEIIALDPGATNLAGSHQRRILITIFWDEGQRHRSVVLSAGGVG